MIETPKLQDATRHLREAIATTQSAIERLEVLLEPTPAEPQSALEAPSVKRYPIPEHEKPKKCKGCGAIIYWVVTLRGRNMPVNPDGTPHWDSCPEKNLFKQTQEVA